MWVGGVSAVLALALVGVALAQREAANPGLFFGAGALLLLAGLGGVSAVLGWLARAARTETLTLGALGLRGCARRRRRSVTVTAMLASGCFLIVSIGAFRLDAKRDATKRTSGTGGFAFLGETTLPVAQDLNSEPGRAAFGLNASDLTGVNVVPFRVREGDEASCLNLNRAQRPRLLGVKPDRLTGRFTFAGTTDGLVKTNPWHSLVRGEFYPKSEGALAEDEVAAIGDAASIQWALGRKLGDMLDYVDEHGRSFKVRLVGALAGSVLQGSLVIDEAEFIRRFPGASGHKFFLVDAPADRAAAVSATLSRALSDMGLELTPAATRLAQFHAVQNTYLNTFQVLGGLGLLLGSAGLGVVVLRNVLERRGELAVLLAVGFRRRLLSRLVLAEHLGLLIAGLGVGVVAALVAVLPALIAPGGEPPSASLWLTLTGVLINGVAWTWLATRWALRGRLLDALRNE